MSDWKEKNVSKAKEIIKNWYYPDNSLSQVIDNLDSAREAVQRRSRAVYQNMLESSRGQELLELANKYNIHYEKDSINWLELIDKVENYEELLQLAKARMGAFTMISCPLPPLRSPRARRGIGA